MMWNTLKSGYIVASSEDSLLQMPAALGEGLSSTDTLSGLPIEAHAGICCAHQEKAEPQDTSSTSLPSSGMVVCTHPAGLGENNTGSS